MASLTLKNLPEELLGPLREAAAQDRRSLTQEVIHLLESALRSRGERPDFRRHPVEAQVAAWRELAGRWESDLDRATEIERIQVRRTGGREVDL